MSHAPSRVLIVESDAQAAADLEVALQRAGFTAEAVAPTSDGLALLEQFEPQVVLVGFHVDQDEVEVFLGRARDLLPNVAFVSITDAAKESVAAAIRAGADSVVSDSVSPAQLAPLLERAAGKAQVAERVQRLQRRAQETLAFANFESIVGSHPAMQELLKRVAYVANTRATVLIYGESGTGKELIAAAVHQNSKRKNGPFVRLNCAALAESVLESELFGHEKGAFTGAVSRREGRFKQADGGTLFLDEISEIPARVQVKLLRFLQERELERVGGNETLRVDVRIVAATNKDLRALVADGKFREDLFFRLAVVKLDVPPLRARPSDVLLLAEHFLRLVAKENDVYVTGFTEAAKKALTAYSWPGNVRELHNAIEQAVIMSESELVGPEHFPFTVETPGDNFRVMVPGVTMAELERYAITQTLKAVGGSATRAAEILGISRRTIQYRIKEWGLSERVRTRETRSEPPPADFADERAPADDEP